MTSERTLVTFIRTLVTSGRTLVTSGEERPNAGARNAGTSCLRASQSPLTLEELALEGEAGEVRSEKERVEREVGSRRLWDFAGWGRGFVPDGESDGSHKAFYGEESKI